MMLNKFQKLFSFFSTKEAVKQQLSLLALMFAAALSAIIFTELYLNHLTHNYETAIQNQMAHRRLGRVIIRKLIEIEKDINKVNTTNDYRDQKILQKQINKSIGVIESALGILNHGGNFTDVLPSNLIENDELTETFSYKRNNDKKYSIALIDLTPKLIEIRKLSDKFFFVLLSNKETNETQLSDQKLELSVLLKMIDTFLLRSREDATKIFAESNNQIEFFEKNKQLHILDKYIQ